MLATTASFSTNGACLSITDLKKHCSNLSHALSMLGSFITSWHLVFLRIFQALCKVQGIISNVDFRRMEFSTVVRYNHAR